MVTGHSESLRQKMEQTPSGYLVYRVCLVVQIYAKDTFVQESTGRSLVLISALKHCRSWIWSYFKWIIIIINSSIIINTSLVALKKRYIRADWEAKCLR